MKREPSDDLSESGRALLERRLAGLGAAAPGAEASRPGRIPLAPAQRRLWFIDQLTRGGLAYNVPTAYRLRGPLDVEALERAFRQVVRRHEVLRTCYPADAAGEPYGVVLDAADTPDLLVSHDLTTAADPVAEAERLAREAADHRFRLDGQAPVRAWLARLGPDDHVFGVVVHHIAFDRESLALLAAEVSTAYRRLRSPEEPALPELPVQYADFAVWQTEHTEGERFERDVAYWRRTLSDVPPVLELPADHERPAEPTYRAGEVPVLVPAATADALRALSADRGATLFMTCLAAFQGLLSRYTGLTALAVGSPVNGRARVAHEQLIGFFANSLPVSTTLADDPPFTTLVDRAKDALLEAHAHQNVPFDRIVQELAPVRDLSRNPLVQVWFDLDAGGTGSAADLLRLPHVAATYFAEGRVRTRFDVELHLRETSDGTLAGRLLYARDLYEPETAQALCRHYANLLESVSADPARRLSQASLFSADELSTLLGDWSSGTA